MKVFLLCGSIAERSHTRALLQAVAASLTPKGAQCTFWDLAERPLPIARPEFHRNPETYPDETVRTFVAHVRQADGFVLATPLYHGSFSGVLKNALDHLWADAFRDKPVALLSHGSTERRCTQPCLALQPVVSTLYGYSAQTMVATTKSDYIENSHGVLILGSLGIFERIERQATELIQLMQLLRGQNLMKED